MHSQQSITNVETDKYKYTKDKLCNKLVYLQDYTEMHSQQNIKNHLFLILFSAYFL